MMHGYLPFDKDGNQLSEFRTWRNAITSEAADKFGSQCVVVAIDAKIFLEIVRKLPDSTVSIDTDDDYKTYTQDKL